MKIRNAARPAAFAAFVLSALPAALVSPLAAPVTTIPWNGHTGAVSFTYDDARSSQIPNLIPQLDSLGLKATFYISTQNIGNFLARQDDWLQVSRDGHELANHTRSHVNVTDGNAVDTVRQMALYLRGLDSTIEAVTFAYPNCSMPGAVGKAGVSLENFIARGCGNTSYAWGTQPADWMNIQGLIMQPTNQAAGVSLLNTAMNQNRWASFIIHDVTESPDQYSLTPANNRALLTTAMANELWIDTYLNIASYYRAHFTIDTARAVVNGNGWKVEWTSPHARMPRRVPLRVQLDTAVFGDSAVVVQGGLEAPRESDGSYVVDFMKLRMDVYPKGTVAVSPAARFRSAPLDARISGRVVRLSGLSAGAYALSIHSASGRLIARGGLRVERAGTDKAFSLRTAPNPGMHQISVRELAGGPVRKIPLLVLP